MTADRQVVEQIRRRVGERITQTIADSEMSGGSPIEGENRRMLAHKLIGEELQVIDTAAMTAGRAPIDDTTRDELSLNPPVWWVCGGCRVREKGLLICDDCDVDSHVRLKNRRHFLCLDHRAVRTGSQRPSIMRAWWPTRA